MVDCLVLQVGPLVVVFDLPLNEGPIASVAVAMDRHICKDEARDEAEGSRARIFSRVVKTHIFFDKTRLATSENFIIKWTARKWFYNRQL